MNANMQQKVLPIERLYYSLLATFLGVIELQFVKVPLLARGVVRAMKALLWGLG